MQRGGQPHSAPCCAATVKAKALRAKALREARTKPSPLAVDKGKKKMCKRSPEAWERRRLAKAKAKNEKRKRPRTSKAGGRGPLRELNALSVARAMIRYRPAWEKKKLRGGGGDDGNADGADGSTRPP